LVRARWLLAALVAVSLAACGGDDEPSNDEVRKPPLTVPTDSSTDSTDTTTDETDATDTTDTAPDSGGETPAPAEPPLDQPNPGNGGTPAPDTNDPPRDSPENDTPPEPGSPEERFEQFCAENPGAC
jgi:hypothetical protein